MPFVSKTDDARNLETQLHILQDYGMREEHILTDELTGNSMSRPAWNELMPLVRPNDIIVVAWLDLFSRNFDEGVRIQAELPKQRSASSPSRRTSTPPTTAPQRSTSGALSRAKARTKWTPPASE